MVRRSWGHLLGRYRWSLGHLLDKRLIFDGDGWPDIKKRMKKIIERPDRSKFDPEVYRKFVEDNYSWEGVGSAFEKEVISLTRCRLPAMQ